jgi:YbbR domain-containing protein
MGWLFRNWELKLGAAALATILYTGLVFSGSFTDARIAGITIQRINQPNGAYVITQQLPSVEVHYRQSRDASATTTDSFAATVDLGQYDMQRAGQAQSLPVQVRSLASGVTVLDFTPSAVTVTLDVLDQKTVDVFVDRGEVPDGLELGNPVLSSPTVLARGPKSLLSQVARAEAQISIDASGIDYSSQVRLVPVDANGEPVASVDLSPDVITVHVTVTTQETNKTVPVRPAVSGAPAAGFQVGQVVIDPPLVTLRGTPEALASIDDVATEPISLANLTADKAFTVKLVVPADVTLAGAGAATVKVQVTVVAATGSRTLLVGVVCRNVPSGDTCLPQVAQIAMTVSGPQPTIAALKPADVTPIVDVAGLAPGTYDRAPTVTLPKGVTLVGFSPAQVRVVIAAPTSSAAPAGG